jgi:hypothetical protein
MMKISTFGVEYIGFIVFWLFNNYTYDQEF